jgi:hypothetical protein
LAAIGAHKAKTPGALPVALRDKNHEGRRRSPDAKSNNSNRGIAMKTTMMALSALAMVCGAAAWSGGVGTPITYELENSWTTAVLPCTDEPLSIHAHWSVRSHEFRTPTGTYHYLESASFSSVGEGLWTGRTWFGKGHETWKDLIKLGPGETFQFTFRWVYRPLEGDGPMYAIDNQYVLRLDADGNVIAELEKGYTVDRKCLGSGK